MDALRARAGRVRVDESGPEPILRLAAWRDAPLSEERASRALGVGFLSTAATALVSYALGELMVTTVATMLLGPAGGAYALRWRRDRTMVTAVAARGSTFVLFARKRAVEHIEMGDVDRIGIGADGRQLQTVWIQRGTHRDCLFRDLTPAEAELVMETLDHWRRMPKAIYR